MKKIFDEKIAKFQKLTPKTPVRKLFIYLINLFLTLSQILWDFLKISKCSFIEQCLASIIAKHTVFQRPLELDIPSKNSLDSQLKLTFTSKNKNKNGLAAFMIAKNILAARLNMELDSRSKNSLEFQLKLTFFGREHRIVTDSKGSSCCEESKSHSPIDKRWLVLIRVLTYLLMLLMFQSFMLVSSRELLLLLQAIPKLFRMSPS